MTTPQLKVHLGPAAVQIFAANDRMNQILIEHLDPAAWKMQPPAKARTIAAIFTHMHNVRCKWVRLTAPHLKTPSQLNRTLCTPQQASAGLAESAARCEDMLADALGGVEALGGDAGRAGTFRRDGWAQPWPAGPEMLCYMLSHEAHHRGQVCMLAHQLGFPLPDKATQGIWNWEKLWKESGSSALTHTSRPRQPVESAPSRRTSQRTKRKTGPESGKPPVSIQRNIIS